jgi:hypothetical protein
VTRLTIFALAAIVLIGGALTLWSSHPAVGTSPRTSATASFFEMHSKAHVENLPVEEFDDQTFVFPRTAHR